jgi:phage terminase large subunit-like protein
VEVALGLQQRYRAAGLEFERSAGSRSSSRTQLPRLHERQERSRKDLPRSSTRSGLRRAPTVSSTSSRASSATTPARSAGKPFRLEPFQERYVREFWRRDRHGRRVYRFGLFAVPKGNGKTPLAAVLGTNALMDPPTGDLPEVYGIAGERKQAGFAQKFVKKAIDEGELGNWLKQSGRRSAARRRTAPTSCSRRRASTRTGSTRRAGLVDEWWQFKHRTSARA